MSPAQLFESLDETTGGAILGDYGGFRLISGRMGSGQGFAQLHPPFDQGVDVPDDALGKNLVLVQGNEAFPVCPVEFFEQEGLLAGFRGRFLAGASKSISSLRQALCNPAPPAPRRPFCPA